MNAREILTYTRRTFLMDKSAVDPLWPDEDLLAGLNWSHKKACDWGLLIRDDEDPEVCFITLKGGQMQYRIDRRIVKVETVWLVWPDGHKTELPARNREDIDRRLGNHWRTVYGQPVCFEPKGREINVAYVPSMEWDGAKLQLDVYRLPLADLELEDPTLLFEAATGAQLPDTDTITYTTANTGIAPMDSATLPVPIDITDPADGTTHSVWPFKLAKYVTFQASHATSIVPLSIALAGYDRWLQPVSETLVVTATGTQKTGISVEAYAYLESIAITALADATADVLYLGVEADTPEVDEAFHDQLAYGVCHLAYLKNDADTERLERSNVFFGKFTSVFGKEVSEKTRLFNLSRPSSLVVSPARRRR